MISDNDIGKVPKPWVIRTTRSLGAFESEIFDSLTSRGIHSFTLKAEEMKRLDEFYDQISENLSFPEYFGRNLMALKDCLSDLEWLDRAGVVILIENADLLLEDESEETINYLMEILKEVSEEWHNPVQENQPWDRGSVLFYVIFCMATNKNLRLAFDSLPYLDFHTVLRNLSLKKQG